MILKFPSLFALKIGRKSTPENTPQSNFENTFLSLKMPIILAVRDDISKTL